MTPIFFKPKLLAFILLAVLVNPTTSLGQGDWEDFYCEDVEEYCSRYRKQGRDYQRDMCEETIDDAEDEGFDCDGAYDRYLSRGSSRWNESENPDWGLDDPFEERMRRGMEDFEDDTFEERMRRGMEDLEDLQDWIDEGIKRERGQSPLPCPGTIVDRFCVCERCGDKGLCDSPCTATWDEDGKIRPCGCI